MDGRTPALVIAIAAVAAPATPARGDEARSGAGRIVRIERVRDEVYVPAGRFTMGVPAGDVDILYDACGAALPGINIRSQSLGPCDDFRRELIAMEPREVHLDGFWIDRTEVTGAMYRACVAAGGCPLDPLLAGDERYNAPQLPMVNITPHEAARYCAWRGRRLPTEAEWEKAARGTDARTWPWGNSERPEDFNHGQPPDLTTRGLQEELLRNQRYNELTDWWGLADRVDGYLAAAPPGTFPWGEGPYGTVDQAGNVAEWVADMWTRQGYKDLPNSNPLRDVATDTSRLNVVRGGSWRQPMLMARSDMRDPMNQALTAESRMPHIGFRCARTR